MYYPQSACALLVFDISDRSTFTSLPTWLSDVKTHATNEHLQIILVGNKADLEDRRQVSEEEAQKFARDNRILYMETSAKTGLNIERVFLETARRQIIVELLIKSRANVNALDENV